MKKIAMAFLLSNVLAYKSNATIIIEHYSRQGFKLDLEEAVSRDDKYIKNGFHTDYYKSGEIKCIYNYYQNKINGKKECYHINGNVKEESYYEDGNLNGDRKVYDINKILLMKEKYYNGYIIDRITYHSSGNPYIVESFDAEGNTDGDFFEYYYDGGIRFVGSYKKGYLVGEAKRYYKNGAIFTEEFFKEGFLEGKKNTYYKNSQIASIEFYLNGLREGIKATYKKNGDKDCLTKYSKGKQISQSCYKSKEKKSGK